MTSLAPPPDLPERPSAAADGRPAWSPWMGIAALLAGFGAATVCAMFIVLIALGFGVDTGDTPAGVSIATIIAQDLCLVGAAVLFARMVARPTPRQFGLVRPRRVWAAVGWAVVALLAFGLFAQVWLHLIGQSDTKDSLPEDLGIHSSTAAAVAIAILVCAVAPFVEELFFRGFIFGAMRNGLGLWGGAAVTGLLFGGAHVLGSPIAFLLPLAFFGFALCLLYARTRSLYPCMALHCVNNSLALGSTMDWGWQIPVVLAGSLALIAATAAVAQRA